MHLFRRNRVESELAPEKDKSDSHLQLPQLEVPAEEIVSEDVFEFGPRALPTPPHPPASPSLTINAQLEECLRRLTNLEAQIQDLFESAQHAPSHGDLLEVRIHSAKLAAELARTTVELRGEIGMATDEARKAAIRTSQANAEELVIDLRESTQYQASLPANDPHPRLQQIDTQTTAILSSAVNENT